jgi:hypothetical protein
MFNLKSNIFDALKQLRNLLASKKLNAEQRQFIETLLVGDGKRSGLEAQAKSLDWRCPRINTSHKPVLEEIKPENISPLDTIQEKLRDEIRKTSFWHLTYKSGLQKALNIINTVIQRREAINNLQEPDVNGLAAIYDELFQETTDKFQGTIVLPINQGLDPRLGASQGECLGYVREWAHCILNHKKPFGIDSKKPPLFNPIKFNTPLGHRYPNLNHLAFLSKNIAEFQSIGIDEAALLSKFSFIDQVAVRLSFYKSSEKIADTLIKLANQDKAKTFELDLFGYKTGHAMGFHKDEEGAIHFMDANLGWVRFNHAEHFKTWLPFYFNKIGYDKIFHEHTIRVYVSHQKQRNLLSIIAERMEQSYHLLIRPYYYLAIEIISVLSRLTAYGRKLNFPPNNNLAATKSPYKEPNRRHDRDINSKSPQTDHPILENISYSRMAGVLFSPSHRRHSLDDRDIKSKNPQADHPTLENISYSRMAGVLFCPSPCNKIFPKAELELKQPNDPISATKNQPA